MGKIFTILGVRICSLDRKSIRILCCEMFDGVGFHAITTLNPEILLEAYHDELYRDILNDSELSTVDGVGLLWAMKSRGAWVCERYTGIDLVKHLLYTANQRNAHVVVVMPTDSMSSQKGISEAFREECPKITYSFVQEKINRMKVDQRFATIQDAVVQIVNSGSSTLVLTSLGAPHQERYNAQLADALSQHKLKSSAVTIGVGGSLDFMTGALRRAPRWMRMLGLEWFYRLAQEPRRLRRIWKAVVVFPALFFMSVIHNKN